MKNVLLTAILLFSGLLFGQQPSSTVMVPMRDGVRLATDIYLPTGAGPWPVVLVRTPYNKTKKLAPQAASENWTPKGYAYVEQDWRGLYASEGKFTTVTLTGTQNGDDGYDTVEWVAKQPWCNGKVGMLGGSGPGIAAKQAIRANPPHLIAAFTNFASMFPGDLELYHGGVLVGQSETWMAGRGVKIAEWPRPRLPLFDFKRFTWPPNHQDAAEGKRIALLDNGGWYDIFDPCTTDDFNARQSPSSRVVMGARGHARMTGSLMYPPQTLPGDTPEDWMDHWLKGGLKGVDNATAKAPPVRYFLMGDTLRKGAPGNVWKQADQWPIPNTPTSFYLTADGGLQNTRPSSKNASRTYAYDPKNPVPMVGGNNMGDNKGPMDQRKLDSRDDILRFQTEPLAEPLEVTGRVMVDLYVGADVSDTTLMAKLIDIHPNGYEALVLDNTLMARFHDSFDKPALLEKGKVYKLSLYLWNTALVFDKGHRIAVWVTGSNAPRYEIHPNSFQPVSSYDNAPVAHVAIQTSAQYPSRLILPVIAPGVSKNYVVVR